MPTFEHTIEIAAPIEQVFAFGLDPVNWQKTNPSFSEFEIVEELDDGLRMDVTYRVLGNSMDGEMEMRYVEPSEQTVSFESPGMTGELRYHYSEIDEGTKVVQSGDYEFGDSFLERVIAPVAKRYNKRQFKQSLELSKDLIEAEAETSLPA